MNKVDVGKVDSFEKLAIMMADMHDDLHDEIDALKTEMVDMRREMRSGFGELRSILERLDTRVAALELAVFGGMTADGGRASVDSLMERIAKLEAAVFKK